jgi:hypothetical protein
MVNGQRKKRHLSESVPTTRQKEPTNSNINEEEMNETSVKDQIPW